MRIRKVYPVDDKKKEVKSTVSLSNDVHYRLREMALKNEMTISQIIEVLLHGRPKESAGYLFFIDKEVLLKIIADTTCKDIDLIEHHINNMLRVMYKIGKRDEVRQRQRSIRKKKDKLKEKPVKKNTIVKKKK